MKRLILTLIILFALCAAFFIALSMPRGIGDKRAINGVLDLTHEDFTETRYKLDGEWEFFFGELLRPEDFTDGTATDAGRSGTGTLIKVPGSWHEAGYPRHGFATYRLIIKTYEPSLMVLLPQITSASVVWINGVKVLEAGTINTDPPSEEHGALNVFVPFSPVDGRVEIIVQAANFSWFTSGLRTSIEMGTPENLIRDTMFRRVVLALFIGMVLAMFLYHGLLFLHHRSEWVYLAFAVFCLITAIQFTLETDGLLHLFWGRNAVLRVSLQIITILSGASLGVFAHLATRIPISKFHRFAYGILFGVPLLIAILIPPEILDRRYLFISTLTAPILFISILRNLKVNRYNYLFLITTTVFFIGQPVNRLFFDERTYYMFLVTPNVFVILSNFLLLSVNFAKAKNHLNDIIHKMNKAQFISSIDELTQLYNRRAYETFAERELNIAKERHLYFGIAMIDIDHFKEYNDTYGHLEGDIALQKVALAVSGVSRQGVDFVARWGGEELVFLAPAADFKAILSIAERIRQTVEEIDTLPRQITVSIGVYSAVPKEGDTPDDFYERADKAVYRAKGDGRNKVVGWTEDV